MWLRANHVSRTGRPIAMCAKHTRVGYSATLRDTAVSENFCTRVLLACLYVDLKSALSFSLTSSKLTSCIPPYHYFWSL